MAAPAQMPFASRNRGRAAVGRPIRIERLGFVEAAGHEGARAAKAMGEKIAAEQWRFG